MGCGDSGTWLLSGAFYSPTMKDRQLCPQPVLTHADGRIVTQDAPIEWGETVVAYGIGFGVYNSDGDHPTTTVFPADGYPAPIDSLVWLDFGGPTIMQITGEVAGLPVGERYVYPTFVGLAPGWVGLAQINFKVDCLFSDAREPRIFIETTDSARTQAFTLLMSEQAKADFDSFGMTCRGW